MLYYNVSLFSKIILIFFIVILCFFVFGWVKRFICIDIFFIGLLILGFFKNV